MKMQNVYVYVLDTLADWELGHVISELNSGRFFKAGAERMVLQTVSLTKEPIKTMGGMTIVPDCLIEDVLTSETNVLLLPGADTWSDPKHSAIIEKTREFLACGATVCAICGATSALANAGLLDDRPHTSNGTGFLDMFAPSYKGQSFYIDEPSVADDNLITAGSAGALQWAKQILARLDVFSPDALEAWYEYFNTGAVEHFYALMQSLSSDKEK